MTEYRFTLTAPDLPPLVIDEPQGWADIIQGIIRDQETHGITYQATVNELGFYGPAAVFLVNQKEMMGLKAQVNFLAEERCKPADPYTEVLRGRLNFGRYKSQCGIECRVTMPVEEEGCKMTFKNRLDQSVDVDSLVAFDKTTNLAPYVGLGFTMELAAQELAASIIGDVGPDGNDFYQADIPAGQGVAVRPIYQNVEDESISISNLAQPSNEYGTFGAFSNPTTPVLLLDEDRRCLPGTFDIDIRLKGTYTITLSGPSGSITGAVVGVYESAQNGDDNDEIIFAKQNLPTGGTSKSGSFDVSFVNPAVTLRGGYGLYTEILWSYAVIGPRPTVTIHWDPETHVSIKATKACPPTETKVYLVNEVLSRIAEATTNGCLRVKSDYYGRVDSQPYASGVDGCGALRVLTKGLHLRRQPNSRLFLSMEEILKDLNAIDNIGSGYEPDPNNPGYEWLRVEPVEYWYQDAEALRCPYIPAVFNEVDESKHYSLIKAGYNKWEPKAVRGLNEFNSLREFRTSLETVKNTIDISSNLIAAGSIIESVRRESFAETGAADTTYDNDTFIICVDRMGYGYKVEQGNIVGDANIFSPSTVYNFRIRPIYSLMRWFRSIANSYSNILDSTAKLFFASGTGNYTATGQLVDPCALENAPIAENKDLAVGDFIDQTKAIPLYRPENISFRYPLTASDFSKLKANSRGYVSVQCGTGDWIKGYIMEVQWTPAKGEAEFKLKLKWQYA